MIQENEIILLILSIGIFIFILLNRSRLKHLPESKILIVGFFTFLTGWIMTVVEGFFWEDFLNIIEHICYIGGAVLLIVWCWKIFGRKEIIFEKTESR